MGCSSPAGVKEIDDNEQSAQDNLEEKNENKAENKEEKEDEKNEEKEDEDKKEEKNDNLKDSKKRMKKQAKQNEKYKKHTLNFKSKKKESGKNEEENRDNQSKDLSERKKAGDEHKIAMNKQQINDVIIMQNVEECFSEDLDEKDYLEMVKDALGENIVDDEKNQTPGTINTNQAIAIAKILYDKINKKNDEIDFEKYPELKGVKVKIEAGNLTKSVVKNVIYNGKKVDDNQIELTYKNLANDNDNIKALSITIQ